jgi:hypothetical protein
MQTGPGTPVQQISERMHRRRVPESGRDRPPWMRPQGLASLAAFEDPHSFPRKCRKTEVINSVAQLT